MRKSNGSKGQNHATVHGRWTRKEKRETYARLPDGRWAESEARQSTPVVAVKSDGEKSGHEPCDCKKQTEQEAQKHE